MCDNTYIHTCINFANQGSKLTVVPDNQNYDGATKLCRVVAPWATQSVVALVLNEDLIDLNKYNSLLSLESKRYLKVSGKKETWKKYYTAQHKTGLVS